MEKSNLKIILFSSGNINLYTSIRITCEQAHCELHHSYTLAELIIKQTHSHAECIIVDEEMDKFHGELMSLLTFANSPKPTILFISSSCDDLWEKISSFAYRIPLSRVGSFIRTHLTNNPYYKFVSKTQGLLNNYLKEVGLDTKYTGYNYIKMALTMALEEKSVIKSLQSKVYPIIALKYNTKVPNVTRNIRSLIDDAYKKEKFNTLFRDKSNRRVITGLLNNFEEILNDYTNMGILS